MDKDKTIKEYMPFIIRTVSQFTKRYVEVENSEELSEAMEAFSDALDVYDEEKGSLEAFMSKVLYFRLTDYVRKKSKLVTTELLDDEGAEDTFAEDVIRRQEIEKYEGILKEYGISFPELEGIVPKHRDSRENVMQVAKVMAQNEDYMAYLLEKKRIPISKAAKDGISTLKVLKTYKKLIAAVMLAYEYEVGSITDWLES